ncbi:acyl-CoA dehydrogenase [Gordonia phthalatica]|uniref:Acyl-CoA dehydrogenase n=2 Tax=Gordonia phthalatica TaxID=1136941 RepID=A0A0N9NGB2_9ACTN|nr:acyl-CoA dehydrogenase [Gordonia phthalatica]
MIDSVFTAHRGEHDSTPVLDRELWARLDELGLIRLTGDERVGGSGAGWWEATELLTAAARHGVRLPLGEHDLLACALLDEAGLPSDDGLVRTIAFADATGVAHRVPWADGVDRVVVVRGDAGVADVDPAACDLQPGSNLIGEPRPSLRLADDTAVRPVDAGAVARTRLKYALVRGVQVCAALDRAVELAIEHTRVRVQFGRPLARQQAVQGLVSRAAAEAALARTATETAIADAVRSEWSSDRLPFLIAVARSCAGHAASVVVRNTHQVHGAIGTTREHRLHEYTRAALAWRGEAGSVADWDRRVQAAATEVGSSGLWTLISGR